MPGRPRITLLELLVIVATCLMFVAILVPSLGKHGLGSHHPVCINNLRAVGQAAGQFAAQYHDQLPTGDGSGCRSLCDVPRTVADLLADNVAYAQSVRPEAVHEIFYCPQNTGQKPEVLWAAAGTRTIGYAWMGPRIGATRLPDLATSPRTIPPLQYQKYMRSAPSPDQTELAFDDIISTPGLNFVSVPGASGGTYRTSHLDSTGQPQGANILCFDGHVEWRAWTGTAGATPVRCDGAIFWLPNP